MKIRMILTALCLGLTLMASGAFAQGKDVGLPKGMMKGMSERDNKILDQLGLTEQQRKALDANREAQMGEIKVLLERMMEASDELNDELMKPKMDMDKVNSLNNEIKTIQGKMADKRVSFITDVRKTIGPEKFEQFLKITQEQRKLRAERRQQRMDKEK